MTGSKLKGKLIVEFYDDILTLHVDIISIKPFLLKSKNIEKSLLAKAYNIRLDYTDDGSRVFAKVDKLNFNNDLIEVVVHSNDDEKITSTEAGSLFSVDYKDNCKLAIIDDENIVKYRVNVEKINKLELNNLGTKIEKVLLTDDLENEKIYRYLLEINSKLDELLSYARPEIEIEGSFESRIISISAENVLVFSERILDSNKIGFFSASLTDSSRQMKFASLTTTSVIRLNDDGTGIYRLKFIELEEEIKDSIMRFVFNIDRANLKRLSRI